MLSCVWTFGDVGDITLISENFDPCLAHAILPPATPLRFFIAILGKAAIGGPRPAVNSW
jgi:hypothetical protein